jgi:hypothetical protein
MNVGQRVCRWYDVHIERYVAQVSSVKHQYTEWCDSYTLWAPPWSVGVSVAAPAGRLCQQGVAQIGGLRRRQAAIQDIYVESFEDWLSAKL